MTGAASGIGQAIAQRLAEEGACVVGRRHRCRQRRVGRARDSADPTSPSVVACDVTDEEAGRDRLPRRRPRIRRGRHRRQQRGAVDLEAAARDDRRRLGPPARRHGPRLVPRLARGGAGHDRPGHGRRPRLRRQQERVLRRAEQRRLRRIEGRSGAPGPPPRRRARRSSASASTASTPTASSAVPGSSRRAGAPTAPGPTASARTSSASSTRSGRSSRRRSCRSTSRRPSSRSSAATCRRRPACTSRSTPGSRPRSCGDRRRRRRHRPRGFERARRRRPRRAERAAPRGGPSLPQRPDRRRPTGCAGRRAALRARGPRRSAAGGAQRRPDRRHRRRRAGAWTTASLDADGALVDEPFAYRDARTATGVERVHAIVPPDAAVRDRTASSSCRSTRSTSWPWTTRRRARGGARRWLLMPDLVGLWLTGRGRHRADERLDDRPARRRSRRRGRGTLIDDARPARDACSPTSRDAGRRARPHRADHRGRGPASTATSSSPSSARTTPPRPSSACRPTGDRFAYISCGTWGLVGVELDRPILTEASRAANFTNERGVDGRIRYLRNVMGLWLLQESMRTWAEAGDAGGPRAPAGGGRRGAAGRPAFDPDDPAFLAARRHAGAHRAGASEQTGAAPPTTRPALVRCIIDSLADAFARAVEDAARLSGRTIEVVHLVGGGARNALLCQAHRRRLRPAGRRRPGRGHGARQRARAGPLPRLDRRRPGCAPGVDPGDAAAPSLRAAPLRSSADRADDAAEPRAPRRRVPALVRAPAVSPHRPGPPQPDGPPPRLRRDDLGPPIGRPPHTSRARSSTTSTAPPRPRRACGARARRSPASSSCRASCRTCRTSIPRRRSWVVPPRCPWSSRRPASPG